MKYIVTLFNRSNPKEKRKLAIEADNEYHAEKEALGGGLREGWGVWRTDVLNPLKVHIFFGNAPVHSLSNGETEEAFENCENGDGELLVIEFATEAEKKAYFQGLRDAQGWEGFMTLEDNYVEEEVPEEIAKLEKLMSKQ